MSFGRIAAFLYYGALTITLGLIFTQTLPNVLPAGLAGAVGRNSEGFAALLVVSVWIEFVRRPLAASARALEIALLVGVGWLVLGLVLRLPQVPAHLHTLNEAALAVGVLIPYLQLRRPTPAWAWLVPLGAVVVPLIGGTNAVTTDLAEAFGALALIPICVDLIDRGVLAGSAVPRGRVVAWMAALVLAIGLLHAFVDYTPDSLFEAVPGYIARVTEMFIAALLLHLYFSLARPELRKQVGPRYDQ